MHQGELIGIPAQKQVALIRVNGAEHTVYGRNSQLVLEGVTGEGRVIGFDVQLEILVESVLSQKAYCRCGIEIILMRHRLLRLGLDIEISLKSDASAVFHSHAHKRSYVFLLKLNIGVQQSFVALSSTPEHIASAAELNGNIERFFYLCRSKAINIDIVGAAGAVHKPRIAEHICRSPKAPDIRAVHFSRI